jgi:hypothetical protein
LNPMHLPQIKCRFSVTGVTLLFSFLLAPLFSIAQDDYKPKPGVADLPSLEMTVFPGDSTADAVVLYDYGDVKFEYNDRIGFVSTLKYRVRIKILKESALSRASVSINYYDGGKFDMTESISNIEGYTYNLQDGQVITAKLDKKSITNEKLSEFRMSRKFNLPNVKKGSVIEYAYTKSTPFKVQDKPDTWTFQGTVPIKWSEYNVLIPNFLDYKMIMGGYLTLSVHEREPVTVRVGNPSLDGAGMRYRFIVKDAPSFTNEPFITTAMDYVSKIRFELARVAVPGQIVKSYSQTWENVDAVLQDAAWFGEEANKVVFDKDLREALKATTSDSTARMNAAFQLVQKTMKWDESGGLGSKVNVKKAFENKKGNATEINLMLNGLLRDLGIDVAPVVLSTRSNGRIMEHVPLLEGFNYTICLVKIGNKEYLLDATQTYGKPGLIPEHAINGKGRAIPKRGKGYFVDLAPKESKNKLEMVEAEINPEEGIVKGTYSASMGGYEALSWREEHATDSDQTHLDELKKQFPDWKIQTATALNKTENLGGVVTLKCDFESENENASPGLFYFNPVIAGRMLQNPLKAPERIYPLDLATGFTNSFIGSYKLPDGYVIEDIPKTEVISLPEKGGRFLFQVKQTGNLIQVNSTMTVSQLVFVPEDYTLLREFFERVVQKHAQPVVIKKK